MKRTSSSCIFASSTTVESSSFQSMTTPTFYASCAFLLLFSCRSAWLSRWVEGAARKVRELRRRGRPGHSVCLHTVTPDLLSHWRGGAANVRDIRCHNPLRRRVLRRDGAGNSVSDKTPAFVRQQKRRSATLAGAPMRLHCPYSKECHCHKVTKATPD